MTYKTPAKQREYARKRRREQGKVPSLLRSDNLRPVNLSSVEIDWLMRVIQALKERHP